MEGTRATNLRGKPSDRIEANGRRVFVQMGESDFDAVGEEREGDLELRMICGQMFECLRASSDNSGLQSSDGAALESRGISEIASHGSGRSRQARVRLEEHAEGSRFSGHG